MAGYLAYAASSERVCNKRDEKRNGKPTGCFCGDALENVVDE
jgi:hypothetical protein